MLLVNNLKTISYKISKGGEISLRYDTHWSRITEFLEPKNILNNHIYLHDTVIDGKAYHVLLDANDDTNDRINRHVILIPYKRNLEKYITVVDAPLLIVEYGEVVFGSYSLTKKTIRINHVKDNIVYYWVNGTHSILDGNASSMEESMGGVFKGIVEHNHISSYIDIPKKYNDYRTVKYTIRFKKPLNTDRYYTQYDIAAVNEEKCDALSNITKIIDEWGRVPFNQLKEMIYLEGVTEPKFEFLYSLVNLVYEDINYSRKYINLHAMYDSMDHVYNNNKDKHYALVSYISVKPNPRRTHLFTYKNQYPVSIETFDSGEELDLFLISGEFIECLGTGIITH